MNIDDTALKTIVAKAIFDGITPEQREELLTKAINTLLTVPVATGYGDKKQPTPLQNIFEYEVQNLARDMVRERFKTDPAVRDMVGVIVSKTISAMATDDNVGVEIGQAIASAFHRANSNF
jgi:hypothetical protein